MTDNRLHNGWADSVPKLLDLVSTISREEVVVRVQEPHRTPEFGGLEHPQVGSPAAPGNQPKSIERGDGPERAIKGLPTTSGIRTIVDDEERVVFPKRFNPTMEALDGRFGAAWSEEGPTGVTIDVRLNVIVQDVHGSDDRHLR